ncbi:hypothetical protein TSUD_77540 [Trifolium subterraneum]|uniref:Uncharacterized protein n=1 Tax=Trifolium subterraneum TaxID=3900 RepID=A0A2Z6M3N2_TRISU|nr:hypothetical protein TSUD_77540 [Trifolium subterraneum]
MMWLHDKKLVGLWTILRTWKNQDICTHTAGLKSILCATEDSNSKTKRVVFRSKKIVTIVSPFPRQVYHIFSSAQFHLSNQSVKNSVPF